MRKARVLVLMVAVTAGAGAAAACNLFSGINDFGYDAGPDGAGSGSTSSSTGSSSGTGGMTGCTGASQCPAVPAGPCASLGTTTCMGGVCGVTYMAGPAPSQRYGSCRKNMCDTTGTETSVADDTNVFMSGNGCMVYTCTSGVLSPTSTQSSMCPFDGGPPPMAMGFCEPDPDQTNPGLYLCSQCNPTAANPCPMANVCDLGTCKPPHCTNGVKDGNETDVDCGGPDCFPCGIASTCGNHSDCFSQQCTGGKCAAPTCTDGFQNGAETDTDCGGPTCPPCADPKVCLLPRDCVSGVCLPSTSPGLPDHCAAPTCTDGVKNGYETGVDCGGPDYEGGVSCPPCAP